MAIHRLERIVLALATGLLAVFLAAIFFGVTVRHIELPHPAGRIDPELLTVTPPFDAPGLVEVAPGRYQAVMRSSIWRFDPPTLTVPAGSTVEFLVATPDVIHGFRVLGTNVNVMVLPGEISRVVHTFDRPGEYLYICHEYCGIGHQAMYGVLTVEPGAVGRVPVAAPARLAESGK